MKPFRRILKVTSIVVGIACTLFLLFLFVGWPKTYPKTYGITWSDSYARYLGIDSNQGLLATLNDLGVRHFRIPAYWNEVEPTRGNYDWKNLDLELKEITEHQGTVILVVGAKQPRWPECWYPDWAKTLNRTDLKQAQLDYVKAVVERYKHTIQRWQIENEPTFFGFFGDCGNHYDKSIVNDEAKLVHDLDPDIAGQPTHPRLTTDSGELTWWGLPNDDLNELGVSVYRIVANPPFKRWSQWFIPPWFYARRALLTSAGRNGRLFVSEFQMEPWMQGDILKATLDQQFYMFDIAQMQKNATYAQQIDVPIIYFWGAEWWYWMKVHFNHPEFWNEAKTIFASSPM